MNRLFTFGCSFTNYRWPTWADVMSQEFDEYQNWGSQGAGNHFILYSLMECMSRNNITKNDTVGIMWSTTNREDRYIKGKWRLNGSIYNDTQFNEIVPNYVKYFSDPDGYFLTSVSVIHAVKNILDSIGCNYYFFITTPLNEKDVYWPDLVQTTIDKKIKLLYEDTLSAIKPSVYEVIFNNDWNSRNYNGNKRFCKSTVEKRWDLLKGPDWPSVDTYIDKQWATYPKWLINELTRFDLIPYNIRIDLHPTPLEHFEYLSKVGIILTEKQKKYAEYWERLVIEGTEIDPYTTGFHVREEPERF